MNVQFYLLFGSVCLLLLSSCKKENSYRIPVDNPTQEENTLYEACLDVHDKAMERMGDIQSWRTKLKEYKDSFPIDESSDEIARINKHLSALNKAENHMFDWMARFKDVSQVERSKLENHLNSMKEEADRMSAAINEAILNAEEYMQNR